MVNENASSSHMTQILSSVKTHNIRRSIYRILMVRKWLYMRYTHILRRANFYSVVFYNFYSYGGGGCLNIYITLCSYIYSASVFTGAQVSIFFIARNKTFILKTYTLHPCTWTMISSSAIKSTKHHISGFASNRNHHPTIVGQSSQRRNIHIIMLRCCNAARWLYIV